MPDEPPVHLHGRAPFHGDPLGVLTACAAVVVGARDVRIDPEAIERFAADHVAGDVPAPVWDDALHYRDADPGPGGIERTAGWIFVLDALNFCFWGQGDDPDHRWRVLWRGEEVDGYAALAAALHRAALAGLPLWDTAWLTEVDSATVARVLAPTPGSATIPLFAERVRHLRELSAGLADLGAGGTPFSTLIAAADGSAVRLVREIVRRFPSFDDVAVWRGPDGPRTVPFHKRAQILVADLAGALATTPLGRFDDLAALTAFADYKVPQVLRALGLIRYEADLGARIDRRERLAAGSRPEVEIRAATIVACEAIRQALAARGVERRATEVDWLLWTAGQSLPISTAPYHRTVTVFY